MAKRRDPDSIDELLFHDGFPEEEEEGGDDLLDEPKEVSEEEEEDDLLPELEIGEDGHIVPRHRKRGSREEDEEESPIVLDWDE